MNSILCASLMLVTADFPVTTAQESQRYPTVYYALDQFYVFWVDERFAAEDSSECLYVARITTSGTVLDPEGILLFREEVTEELDVAYDGTNFLVTFRNYC
jgi:hypothetical protein